MQQAFGSPQISSVSRRRNVNKMLNGREKKGATVVFGVMFVFHLAAGSDILTYILAATVCRGMISKKRRKYLTIVCCHARIFTIPTE